MSLLPAESRRLWPFLVAFVSAAEVGKLPEGRRENTQSTTRRNRLRKIVPAKMARNRVKQIPEIMGSQYNAPRKGLNASRSSLWK
jgi:hypothetical protein